MALAISIVRIEPDAPTIMPATIIAWLFSARPAAAADNPVSALSNEMTTGMSAPPMGNTTNRPIRPATTSRMTIQYHGVALVELAFTPMTTATATATIASTTLATWSINRPMRRALAALGFWQLERRAWKQDLIAAVESAPYAFSPWLGDQVREPALREALG